jgi:hypothetical protein
MEEDLRRSLGSRCVVESDSYSGKICSQITTGASRLKGSVRFRRILMRYSICPVMEDGAEKMHICNNCLPCEEVAGYWSCVNRLNNTQLCEDLLRHETDPILKRQRHLGSSLSHNGRSILHRTLQMWKALGKIDDISKWLSTVTIQKTTARQTRCTCP